MASQPPSPLGRRARQNAELTGGAGPAAEGSCVVFHFEGKPIVAREGQSVAAALIQAGIRSWRIDEAGHHKGALCCVGYCFECRCRIDDQADRRACMTVATAGMRVERQNGAG
jgi:D-hydroxyproline dehydrogenase subunit gamma